MEVYTLINGCGFPYFSSSVVFIRIGDEKIIVDTGSIIIRKNLIENLKDIGIETCDINHLFFTHLHMDHYGNIDLFQNAKIYTTYPEYAMFQIINNHKTKYGRDFIVEIWKSLDRWKPFANTPLLLNNEGGLYDSIKDLSDRQKKNLVYIKEGMTFFDTLNIIRCYGHSVEHIGIHFNYEGESVIIVGDSIPNRRGVERFKNRPHTANVSQMFDELNIKVTGKLGNIVIPGHDRPFNLDTCKYTKLFALPKMEGVENNG